jgi:hypothetical protein
MSTTYYYGVHQTDNLTGLKYKRDLSLNIGQNIEQNLNGEINQHDQSSYYKVESDGNQEKHTLFYMNGDKIISQVRFTLYKATDVKVDWINPDPYWYGIEIEGCTETKTWGYAIHDILGAIHDVYHMVKDMYISRKM